MINKGNYIIQLVLISMLFSQEIFEGYTLFSSSRLRGAKGAITYLKDNDYNNIQTWSHSYGPASMPYLIEGHEPGWENTLLIYPYRVKNPTMQTGGVGGGVHCLTWNGDMVWSYVISNNDYQHHHDVEPLPNGNLLMIAWEKKTSTEANAAGRKKIDNPLNQMWSTAIFEIQPKGSGSAEIVWEWHLWDHLIQDADPDDENYGVVEDHPELFDINNGNVGNSGGPGEANADWMHINAISYNADFDQIVISSRLQDEIFVIDHSITTEEAVGHTGGNYGKGGDILYRWGNPQNYGRGDSSDKILDDQHGINWIPEGYPGEGNFILFNNGSNEALEFISPIDEDGFYYIEDGQPYGPNETIWDSPNYSSAMQGGAFRLPNGNTLITDCDDATIQEVTENGNIVWNYTRPGKNSNIARAQKYPKDYFDNIDDNIDDLSLPFSVRTIPDIISLFEPFPNPFNPVTSISYELSVISNVNLTVYDMTGRKVAELYKGTNTPGYHTISWNALGHSSGIYYVKMRTGEYINTQKLMLVK